MLFSGYFWFKWIVLEISEHVNERIQTIIGTGDEFHAIIIHSKIPKRKRGNSNKTAKRKGPNFILVCPFFLSFFFFYWSWFVLCIIALVMMKLFETEIVKENDCWWLLNNFSSRNWNPPGQNYLKINCYYLLVTKLLIRNSKKLFVFILECLWLNSINKFQIKIHSPY